MTSSVSSHSIEENSHKKEKGDISFDDVNGRRNRSCDDGELRGDIRVDDVRRGSRSKDTSQFSSRNMGETVSGEGKFGYRSYTSHSSSYNPGENNRLLHITFSSRHLDDGIHENEIVDSRIDGERRGIRSQEIIHSYFHNE